MTQLASNAIHILRQSQRIDGMNDSKLLQNFPHLVALDAANEMPSQRSRQCVDLRLRLLQTTLSKNLLTRLHRFGNVACRKSFRHCHQLNIAGLATSTATGSFHAPPYLRQIRRNALHQRR